MGETHPRQKGLLWWWQHPSLSGALTNSLCLQFILKSLPDVERKTLLELLPAYVEHLKSQPCTLLCRFVGLYEVRHRKHGRLSFVVMENILGKAGELQIHEL